MLAQFEGELSKLDKGGDDTSAREESGAFFPQAPGRQEPAGRVKVKVRR